MHVQVIVISPPGFQHAGAFTEVAETLVLGFRALGHTAQAGFNSFAADALNVVLGAHMLDAGMIAHLPANTVIYNMEQVEDALFQWAPVLKALFARFEVWDYSQANLKLLRPHAPRLFHLPIGTVPEMTRIVPAAEQDIDVLFYGQVNERRRVALKAMADAGLAVKAVFGSYGAARDALIGRAKLVVNLHKHDAQVFEVVRVSYLLANAKAVVSEVNAGTAIEPDLVDSICGVPYDDLTPACCKLAEDGVMRRALEQCGHARMMARDEADYLRRLLDQRKAAPAKRSRKGGRTT